MAAVFRIWFKWGFVTLLASLWLAVLLLYLNTRQLLGNFREVIIGFFVFAVCSNSLAWLVMGGLWRFSNGGKVASGDKLVKSQEQIANDALWQESLKEAQYEYGY